MKFRSAGTATLLAELQTMLATGKIERRVESLQRVTNLFLRHEVVYSDAQIAVFDDVFVCLVAEMENAAKEMLAQRLAYEPKAPLATIRTLAFDEAINVAGPVLTHSNNLDDASLIENVETRSQLHMLAIAGRERLNEAVTDALVKHGNDDVIIAAASNPGAEFSENGYTTLLGRAENNDAIATCVGSRRSIPRHHYLKLIAKASDAVRTRLAATHPEWSDNISPAVRAVARRARSVSTPLTPEASIAHGLVRTLYEEGRLNETQVLQFADTGRFDEASSAIACLANVPVAVSESLMVQSGSEGLFVLAKVAGLSWPTVVAMMTMRDNLSHKHTLTPAGMRADQVTYEELRVSTAQQVLRFHRMQTADSGSSV